MGGVHAGEGVRPRVVTLPLRHPYVDAVLPAGVEHAAVGRPPDLGWLPDPLWAPGAVRARLRAGDVVHVHFGYDDLAPDHLREWTAALAQVRAGLVVTVHDLRNPHHPQRSRHDAQLAVLLAAAGGVLTLTPGAAAETAARFGVRARVVPHPAVFPGPAAVATEAGTVGVLLKPWRASVVDPAGVLAVAAAAVRAAGGRLRIDANEGSLTDPVLRAQLAILAAAPGVSLAEHPRRDDDALRTHLTRQHVTLLVHRFGTHSGWVEAAHDVGTTAVVPSCGYYAQQWPAVVTYGHDEARGFDAASLHHALVRALAAPPAAPADRARRAAQLAENHAVHAEVYAEVASAAAGVRA